MRSLEPDYLLITAGLPLELNLSTSFVTCVVFPLLSHPSNTMRAPLLIAPVILVKSLVLGLGFWRVQVLMYEV